MIFRATFEVIHDDGSKLSSMTREYQADSWIEVYDHITNDISNPPYEVNYHLDLIGLNMINKGNY